MRQNKLIIFFIFPVFLFLIGIIASLVFGGISFSTISYVHSKDVIKQTPQRIFVKGDTSKAVFIAAEQNLGIVEIRFDKFNGVNYTGTDRLSFKIKEENTQNWYYENIYSINQFEKSFKLPFGFPIIKDSKNKKYAIEIKSLDGNGVNSVKISKVEPVFQTVYQFPKQEILSTHFLAYFLITKTVFSFNNIDFLLSSTLYLIPFLIYLILLLIRQKINVMKRVISYMAMLFILIDSFLITGVHTGIILLLIGIWVLVTVIYKLESSVTFFVSFLFLLVTVFLISLGIANGQEKLGVYIYGLFIVGLVQAVYELRTKPKNQVNYKSFLKEILKIDEK